MSMYPNALWKARAECNKCIWSNDYAVTPCNDHEEPMPTPEEWAKMGTIEWKKPECSCVPDDKGAHLSSCRKWGVR